MEINSNVSMMIRSAGPLDTGPGNFTENDIEGDFEAIPAPSDWREILIAASTNTAGMAPLTTDDLGDEDDWLWFVQEEADDQGYLTGITWQVAAYKDDTTVTAS